MSKPNLLSLLGASPADEIDRGPRDAQGGLRALGGGRAAHRVPKP